MSEPPRLILLDFDYTLVDPSGWVFDALRAGLDAVAVPHSDDMTMKRLIGIPLERQFEALADNLRDARKYSAFKTAYVKRRDATAFDKTRMIDGAVWSVGELRNLGYVLGIVSTGDAA